MAATLKAKTGLRTTGEEHGKVVGVREPSLRLFISGNDLRNDDEDCGDVIDSRGEFDESEVTVH